MLNKVQKIWKQFQAKSLSVEDIVETLIGKVPLMNKIASRIVKKLHADQAFYVHIWTKQEKNDYTKEIFKKYLENLIFPSKNTKLSAVIWDYTLVSLYEDEHDIVLQAYEVNSRAIQHMKYHSPELQRHVVKQMGREYSMSLYIDALKVTEQDVAHAIIDINHAYLRMIPESLQTEELVWKVIEHRPELIEYVKNPSEKIKLYICEKCPSKVKEIKDTTYEMEMIVLKRLPSLFEYIQNPDDRTCMYFLENIEQFLKDVKQDHMPFRAYTWKNMCQRAIDKATTEATKVYGTMKYASIFNQ